MPRELQPKQPDPSEQASYELGRAIGRQLYGDPTTPRIARQTFFTEREIEQAPDGRTHARERELQVDEYYSPLMPLEEQRPSGSWLKRLFGGF